MWRSGGRYPEYGTSWGSQKGLRLSFYFSKMGLCSQEPAEGWAPGPSSLLEWQQGNGSWLWKWGTARSSKARLEGGGQGGGVFP